VSGYLVLKSCHKRTENRLFPAFSVLKRWQKAPYLHLILPYPEIAEIEPPPEEPRQYVPKYTKFLAELQGRFPVIERGQAFRLYCTGISHMAGIHSNP